MLPCNPTVGAAQRSKASHVAVHSARCEVHFERRRAPLWIANLRQLEIKMSQINSPAVSSERAFPAALAIAVPFNRPLEDCSTATVTAPRLYPPPRRAPRYVGTLPLAPARTLRLLSSCLLKSR